MGMNSIGGFRPWKMPENKNLGYEPQTLTNEPKPEPDKGKMQPKNPHILINPYDEDGNYIGFPEGDKNIDWKQHIDNNIDINYW